MQPRMSPAEISLLQSFLVCSDRYLEFGSGGSTCLAAEKVRTAVISVDSDPAWLKKIETYCAQQNIRLMPQLHPVDIGKTGSWGMPIDLNAKDKWPDYHRSVWNNAEAAASDLFLVDGRFRVACFMQIVLRCRPGAIIMVHDFTKRPVYHPIFEVARQIAIADSLVVFQPLPDLAKSKAEEILDNHFLVYW